MADPSETTRFSLDPNDARDSELLDAVRALSAEVGSLQSEVRALRAETRALPLAEVDAPGWEDSTPASRQSSPWMRSLDRPVPRGPVVPRLLLEVVFLVTVAVAAALAELDPVVIVVLMAAAWILVAVAEWTVARAARRQAEVFSAPLAGGVFADDPSWFGPPVKRTVLDPVEDTQEVEDTATRLPPPSPD